VTSATASASALLRCDADNVLAICEAFLDTVIA